MDDMSGMNKLHIDTKFHKTDTRVLNDLPTSTVDSDDEELDSVFEVFFIGPKYNIVDSTSKNITELEVKNQQNDILPPEFKVCTVTPKSTF